MFRLLFCYHIILMFITYFMREFFKMSKKDKIFTTSIRFVQLFENSLRDF